MLSFGLVIFTFFMPFASALLYDISGTTHVNAHLPAILPNRKPERDIWKERRQYSEYFHLVPHLRNDPALFHNYYRMSKETFDYLLECIAPRLTKEPTPKHPDPISPGEKLSVTLR